MYRIILLMLAIASLSCKEQGKELSHVTDNKLANIAPYLQKISMEGFSGSVLINYKGALFTQGYGSNDERLGIPNSEETVYDIGSITKQFTGAGILKLEMMGKLSLENTLPDYFSNVPEDKKGISIHHLLTHSSGLIDGFGNDYDAISESDFLNHLWNTDLLHKVGSKYHYSNVGYSLLALIIEKVSAQTYEEFLSEQLFLPAGMNQTGYSLPQWEPNAVATGYHNKTALGKPNEQNWDGNEPYLHLKGNGGILSTVGDMYKWHQALVSNDILDAKAKEKYYYPHIKEDASGRSHYGYGWAIFPTPRNTQLITHNGGNGVFFADFLRYLSEDITIILMSNRSSAHTERVAMQLAGLLLVDDFEPLLPSDMEDEMDDAEIDEFVMDTFLAIRDGHSDLWKTMLEANASQDFLDRVPMETHYEFLGKMKKRLEGSKISGIFIEDNALIAEINSPSESLRMILTLSELESGAFLLDGIKLEKKN